MTGVGGPENTSFRVYETQKNRVGVYHRFYLPDFWHPNVRSWGWGFYGVTDYVRARAADGERVPDARLQVPPDCGARAIPFPVTAESHPPTLRGTDNCDPLATLRAAIARCVPPVSVCR